MVIDEVTIDDVGELSLEAALCLLGCLELANLAVVVLASRSTVPGLDDGHCVKGVLS
jgi:hypothetical protein